MGIFSNPSPAKRIANWIEERSPTTCGDPTNGKHIALYSLSCCDDHPSTHEHHPHKASQGRCWKKKDDVAGSDSSDLATVKSSHPWIPIHISYQHLKCMRQHLFADKRAQRIMNLSVEGCGRRKTAEVDIKHKWLHDIFELDGVFVQGQTSEVSVSIMGFSIYEDKFENCPHSYFTLSKMRTLWSTSLGRAQATGKISDPIQTRTFDSLKGGVEVKTACNICATEAALKVTFDDIRFVKINYTCLRRLGTGTDIASDQHWRSLLAGRGTLKPSNSDFSLMELRKQRIEKEKPISWVSPKGRRPLGVKLNWDVIQLKEEAGAERENARKEKEESERVAQEKTSREAEVERQRRYEFEDNGGGLHGGGYFEPGVSHNGGHHHSSHNHVHHHDSDHRDNGGHDSGGHCVGDSCGVDSGGGDCGGGDAGGGGGD